MRTTLIGVAVVAVAAVALGGAATAAAPSASTLTLQPADMAGAKVVSKGSVKESGYLSAYQRTFQYSAPTSTGLVFVQSETLVAPSVAKAAADLAAARRSFGSKATRAVLVASIAKSVNVKAKAVAIGTLRTTHVGDGGFELPLSVKTAHGKVYESLAYFRLDAVVSSLVEAGTRPVSAGATAGLQGLVAGHVGAALVPVGITPPTVTGAAQQGQTLTAVPGTWSAADATFTYQWQHCDAAGASCVDVAGATGATYAVTAADVNTTLHIVVTATNRFGTATATSLPTAPVV